VSTQHAGSKPAEFKSGFGVDEDTCLSIHQEPKRAQELGSGLALTLMTLLVEVSEDVVQGRVVLYHKHVLVLGEAEELADLERDFVEAHDDDVVRHMELLNTVILYPTSCVEEWPEDLGDHLVVDGVRVHVPDGREDKGDEGANHDGEVHDLGEDTKAYRDARHDKRELANLVDNVSEHERGLAVEPSKVSGDPEQAWQDETCQKRQQDPEGQRL
jgi:hypothetical protein